VDLAVERGGFRCVHCLSEVARKDGQSLTNPGRESASRPLSPAGTL
jgi:hypothetical protein